MRTLTRLGVAVALALSLSCGGPGADRAGSNGEAVRPVPRATPAGRLVAKGERKLWPQAGELYESARQAFADGDLKAMADHLERAILVQPDFTEAWYNLGACRTNLAQQAAAASSDVEAVQLFRDAVDAKRRARELMDQGVWYVYTSVEEQQQVRSDVERALEDVDALLEDQATLLAALRATAP